VEVTAPAKTLQADTVVNATLATKTTEKVVCCVSTSTNAVPLVNQYAKETAKTSRAVINVPAQGGGDCQAAKTAKT